MKSGSWAAYQTAQAWNENSEPPDRNDANMHVRHATWANDPHIGLCYSVRNRGHKTWRSIDGVVWFTAQPDAAGNTVRTMIRPLCPIRYHGGTLEGCVTEIVCGIRARVNRGPAGGGGPRPG